MNSIILDKLSIVTCCFLVGFTINLNAQEATVSDCLGAIPVCDDIYFEESAYEDEGNYENELHEDCCVEKEKNSVWYRFSPNSTGDLGFEIIPNDLEDDYDWAVFNITNTTCAEIKDDFSAIMSCNATGKDDECKGVTGANGGTEFNFQNLNCNTFPPTLDSDGYRPFNDFIPVIQGNEYVLLIVNFDGSENGYTLDFTVGEVSVSDNENPVVSNIIKQKDSNCNLESIKIEFSELIQCNSFNVEDLAITGASTTSNIDLIAPDCEGSMGANNFILTFNPPLTKSGEYFFSINSDPLDLCNNPHLEFSFEYINENSFEYELALDTVLCGNQDFIIGQAMNNVLLYEWESGEVSPTLEISESGSYVQNIYFECNDTLIREFRIIIDREPNVIELKSKNLSCVSGGEISFTDIIGDSEYVFSIDAINYQESNTFNFLEQGAYTYYIKSDYDCITEYPINIEEYVSDVTIELPTDLEIYYGDTINVNAEVIGIYDSFLWKGDTLSMSCTDCLNFDAFPLINSIYTLEIYDSLNCLVTDEILIRVINEQNYYAPNIFTPNGDGTNDRFIIFGDKQMEIIESLSVYDRWGELVYESEQIQPGDITNGWDGSFKGDKANPGVYVFHAILRYADQSLLSISGPITIAY